jgi:hypothetical protein
MCFILLCKFCSKNVSLQWIFQKVTSYETHAGFHMKNPSFLFHFKHNSEVSKHHNFLLISLTGGWSPTGSTRHVGHKLAYCICPGWLWERRIWWNDDWEGKPKYSEKAFPNATLSTTNSTFCPDANSGLRGGKTATNRLSYDTAFYAS